jgi:hypothetical protein
MADWTVADIQMGTVSIPIKDEPVSSYVSLHIGRPTTPFFNLFRGHLPNFLDAGCP